MEERLPGTGLGPLLGLGTTAALGSWLAGRALAAGAALAASPGRVADLSDAVSVPLLWAGCAAAAWYGLTCAVVLAIRAGRATGATTSRLEDAVRRWGFPVLRRTLLTTVAAGAGLSLTVGAAGATPAGGEPPVPRDLGWGAGVVAVQAGGIGTALGEALPSSLPSEARPPAGGTDPPDDAMAAATGRTATGRVDETATTPTAPGVAGSSAEPTGGATPDVAPGGHGAPAATSAPSPPERSLPDAETYRVQAGDSLWSIAAAHLGEDATTEEVARAWPEWYRANRPGLGPDPHLIHPGQLLQVPDEEAS